MNSLVEGSQVKSLSTALAAVTHEKLFGYNTKAQKGLDNNRDKNVEVYFGLSEWRWALGG